MPRFHFVTCDFGKGVVSCPRFGDVAQLGERCLRKAEAGGSSPLISTISSNESASARKSGSKAAVNGG